MSSYEIISHKSLPVGVRITRIEWGTQVKNHFNPERGLGAEVLVVDNTAPIVYLVSQYIAATADQDNRTYCGPLRSFESRVQAMTAFRALKIEIESATKCVLCGQYALGACGCGFQEVPK
jgi:hypothetical protein